MIVVRDRPTFAVLIAHTVRRIGYHEIHKRIWQPPQYASAITLKNFVDREHDGMSIGIGGFADALPRSRRAERSIETRRDVGIMEGPASSREAPLRRESPAGFN